MEGEKKRNMSIFSNLSVVISAVEPYFNIMAHVSMCASVLLIVAFTFERHFAIRSPHQYRIHIW